MFTTQARSTGLPYPPPSPGFHVSLLRNHSSRHMRKRLRATPDHLFTGPTFKGEHLSATREGWQTASADSRGAKLRTVLELCRKHLADTD